MFTGDSFHIRTHMTYEAPKGSNHLSFKPGDIFKVTDTLRSGVIGMQLLNPYAPSWKRMALCQIKHFFLKKIKINELIIYFI